MTDYQLASVFQNMSTQAAKVVASNAEVMDTVQHAGWLVAGLIMAVIVACTWKG